MEPLGSEQEPNGGAVVEGRLAEDELIPAFAREHGLPAEHLRALLTRAVGDWLTKSPSRHTREAYRRDVGQFLQTRGIAPEQLEALVRIRPGDVARWRDELTARGQTNHTVRRKLTALRSLFSYLQVYGYTGANPAHGKFVQAPAVPQDGKTVGLTPKECRALLDAPDPATPVGLRDRALFAVLAYTACRVSELTGATVGEYQTNAGHRVLGILAKGGKERIVPLHPEAWERLDAWLQVGGHAADAKGPLFRPPVTARGQGRDGFRRAALTRQAVHLLLGRYAARLGLDPAVTVHSFRVTALTTAREQGVDIIDLQDFAGHADPRTTLTYIRSRDRLSKSPAYVLRY